MRLRCSGRPGRQAEGSRSFQGADFGPGYEPLAWRKGRIGSQKCASAIFPGRGHFCPLALDLPVQADKNVRAPTCPA